MRVLDAAHQVTRIGEGWDPTAAGQHRVPPDVVDMHMRANDRVYGLASIAGRCQISEEIRLELVPGRDAPVLLVVAETGVDDDAPAGRFDDERWMLILSRPSSSAKWGCSQPIGNTASRVACGRMNRLPPVTSSSTILVTVTAPIRHFICCPIG